MIRASKYLALGALIAPSLLFANDLSLSIPIDCELGKSCYIQQYVDHDPSSKWSDYRCSSLSYDTHKGTDFALPTLSDIKKGVAVLAAADGIVAAFRDNVEDKLYRPENAAEVAGKECGNGVVINHDGGWQTQYCHLKKGSVSVVKGQQVKTGDMLGHVGLSGKTQFPHVHLSVRKNQMVIDPFSPKGRLSCNPDPTESLWVDELDYVAGGFLNVGFYDAVPSFEDIKAGTINADHLTTSSDALVLYAHSFGTQTDDIIRFTIEGPRGVIHEQETTMTKNQAMAMRASGRKSKRRYWNAGDYLGIVELVRDGRIIDQSETTITLK